MPLLYPIKRVFRSWKLFIALLIGVILASTFFAGIDVKANLTAKQALEQQLNNVLVDMEVNTRLNSTNFVQAQQDVLSIEGVEDVEIIARLGAPMLSSSDNYTDHMYSQIIYLPNSSRVYAGWENRPLDGIGENETYVLADTSLADRLSINDTLMMASARMSCSSFSIASTGSSPPLLYNHATFSDTAPFPFAKVYRIYGL
jgi:hypothetical protein